MLKSIKMLSHNGKVMLLCVLLTNISTYMLSPFLALYMSSKNFSANKIGIVLMVSLLFQQGLNFFGGIFGDRLGYRFMIMLGLAVRILGYITFMYSRTLIMFCIAAALVGTGGAFISPSSKASMGSEEKLKAKAFALRNIALNVGAALGPILGSLLYKVSFKVVFLAASCIHGMLFILIMIAMTQNKVVSEQKVFVSISRVIVDKKLLYLTFVSALFWFVYAQLNLSIPLYVQKVLAMGDLTGNLFTLNGLTVIAIQFQLVSYFEKKFSYSRTLQCGMLFMAVSFLVLNIRVGYGILYVFVLLFTVGEILVAPAIDNVTSMLAPDKTSMGSYLGFVSLAGAAGGALGNLAGGHIFDAFYQSDCWIMWLIYTGIAAVAALLFGLFKKAECESV